MKPITKKYNSKDNIAYNDGLEEGRRKALQEELEFWKRERGEMNWNKMMKLFEERISKIEKELGK